MTKIINTNMNEVLKSLDRSLRREKALRGVIDELFLIICTKCTEEEIKEIRCLDTLKDLAKAK